MGEFDVVRVLVVLVNACVAGDTSTPWSVQRCEDVHQSRSTKMTAVTCMFDSQMFFIPDLSYPRGLPPGTATRGGRATGAFGGTEDFIMVSVQRMLGNLHTKSWPVADGLARLIALENVRRTEVSGLRRVFRREKMVRWSSAWRGTAKMVIANPQATPAPA
jgi:hypothetical protein